MSCHEVDVFISNYTLVDPEVYQLWVEGHSSSEAVSALESRGIMQQTGATIDLVESDVLDHYRTYNLLERLLHNPPKLAEQLSFQIEPQTQQLLIEKYYEFDDSVIRELLGKKLSSRHRKDLDEVSEKTNVLLKSCRRQFDNVKRVFKAVEELPGNIVQNIKSNFLLSDELSKKYGAIVFIACVRFETSKRKLQYLTFSDFYHCAIAIMNKWTYRDVIPEFDLDREFLLDLRDVRIVLDKEREHKHYILNYCGSLLFQWRNHIFIFSKVTPFVEKSFSYWSKICRDLKCHQGWHHRTPLHLRTEMFILVCSRLKPTLLEKSYQELENNFRSYTRAIVGLACNLHRSRELRSLFVELVERCVEPWRQVAWSYSDLKNFLVAYEQCAIEMDVFREADLKAAWERYMSTISYCLLKMYHTQARSN